MIALDTLPDRPGTIYQIGDRVARDGYAGTVTDKTDGFITVDFELPDKEPNVIPLRMARLWLTRLPGVDEQPITPQNTLDSPEATTAPNPATIEPPIQPTAVADGSTQETAITTTKGKFAQYEATYSADRLDQTESRIKAVFGYEDRQWVCLMVHDQPHRQTLRAYEVVPQSAWDGELVDRAGMQERRPHSYEGLLTRHKKAALVFTGRSLWFGLESVTSRNPDSLVEAEMLEATYPIGSRVKIKLNLFGDLRQATGIIVPTMSNGREMQLIHQVSVEYECVLPDISKIHEHYREGYPADGVSRGVVQVFKKNVEVLAEQGLEPGFQTVALSRIMIDSGLQPRANVLDEPAIAQYQEDMTAGTWDWTRKPMIGFWDAATAQLRLAVGGHRYEAARRAGLLTVQLEVRLEDRSEAVLTAATENMDHGVRMSGADRSRAIALMLKDPTWSKQSDSAIARTLTGRGLRCDHKRVGDIRRALESDGTIEPVLERIVVRKGVATVAKVKTSQPPPAAEKLGELPAETLDEYRAKAKTQSCFTCTKREPVSEAEFLCTALATHHSSTDDPGAMGCRHHQPKRWNRNSYKPDPNELQEAFAPFSEPVEQPPSPQAAKKLKAREALKSAIARYVECEDCEWSEAELEDATILVEGALSNFNS